MYRIKISGNFLVILNNTDQAEYARHPLGDADYEPFDELTDNPLIRFSGINKSFGIKAGSKSEFRFNELLDDVGIAFTSFSVLSDLLDNNLGKHSGGSASISTSDIFHGGFVDYNDSGTPIVVTAASSPVIITNDGAGAFTNKTYLPVGITDVWDVSSNRFDWTDLKLGDMIDIRLDINLVTSSVNTEISVNLMLAEGTNGEYNIPFLTNTNFKDVTTHNINRFNGIYMGDENSLLNQAVFKISADKNCSIIVNGWYCKIIRKG